MYITVVSQLGIINNLKRIKDEATAKTTTAKKKKTIASYIAKLF